MKVLLTGAAGFIGSAVDAQLTARGDEVVRSGSTQTAAWLPPATLGFIAAASAAPNTPMIVGGEFTQPKNRGCPLPNG